MAGPVFYEIDQLFVRIFFLFLKVSDLFADKMNKVDVLPLILSPNVIGLTVSAFFHDSPYRPTVIVDVKTDIEVISPRPWAPD